MKHSTSSTLLMALVDFQRAAVDYLGAVARRLAEEEGLSPDTLRRLEVHLRKLMTQGAKLEQVIGRLPDPTVVPQWMRDGIQQTLAQSQYLLDAFKFFKTCATPHRHREDSNE